MNEVEFSFYDYDHDTLYHSTQWLTDSEYLDTVLDPRLDSVAIEFDTLDSFHCAVAATYQFSSFESFRAYCNSEVYVYEVADDYSLC